MGLKIVVVEMMSSSSNALSLKNAWKVSDEKYEALKNGKTSTEHKWTSKMPALSNGRGLSNANVAQSTANRQEQNSGVEQNSLREVFKGGTFGGKTLEAS